LQSVKQIPCPRCGALAPFSPQNRWRPFCSERCKTIDLGGWAAERYRVASEEREKNPSEEEEKRDDPA